MELIPLIQDQHILLIYGCSNETDYDFSIGVLSPIQAFGSNPPSSTIVNFNNFQTQDLIPQIWIVKTFTL